MKPDMTALVDRYVASWSLGELEAEKLAQAQRVAAIQDQLSAAQQTLSAIAKARKIINRKQRGTVYGR